MIKHNFSSISRSYLRVDGTIIFCSEPEQQLSFSLAVTPPVVDEVRQEARRGSAHMWFSLQHQMLFYKSRSFLEFVYLKKMP